MRMGTSAAATRGWGGSNDGGGRKASADRRLRSVLLFFVSTRVEAQGRYDALPERMKTPRFCLCRALKRQYKLQSDRTAGAPLQNTHL